MPITCVRSRTVLLRFKVWLLLSEGLYRLLVSADSSQTDRLRQFGGLPQTGHLSQNRLIRLPSLLPSSRNTIPPAICLILDDSSVLKYEEAHPVAQDRLIPPAHTSR